MNKEVIIEMLDNKLLIMEELKQVQASIFNGEVKSIMLFIENQQQELERYKNIIEKAKKLCEDSWGTYYWECGNGYEDMMNILEGKKLKGE